jgi:hypothetical protein
MYIARPVPALRNREEANNMRGLLDLYYFEGMMEFVESSVFRNIVP